jgi:hypothetical protein
MAVPLQTPSSAGGYWLDLMKMFVVYLRYLNLNKYEIWMPSEPPTFRLSLNESKWIVPGTIGADD